MKLSPISVAQLPSSLNPSFCPSSRWRAPAERRASCSRPAGLPSRAPQVRSAARSRVGAGRGRRGPPRRRAPPASLPGAARRPRAGAAGAWPRPPAAGSCPARVAPRTRQAPQGRAERGEVAGGCTAAPTPSNSETEAFYWQHLQWGERIYLLFGSCSFVKQKIISGDA